MAPNGMLVTQVWREIESTCDGAGLKASDTNFFYLKPKFRFSGSLFTPNGQYRIQRRGWTSDFNNTGSVGAGGVENIQPANSTRFETLGIATADALGNIDVELDDSDRYNYTITLNRAVVWVPNYQSAHWGAFSSPCWTEAYPSPITENSKQYDLPMKYEEQGFLQELVVLRLTGRFNLSFENWSGADPVNKDFVLEMDYELAVDLANIAESQGGGRVLSPEIPVNLNGDGTQIWSPVLDPNCNQPVDSEPFGYTDLIKRDFATADTRNLHIHALEIFCEDDPLNETYFLCNDTTSHDLTVDGVTQTFQAANFSFSLPQTTEDSTPEMQLTISNVDGVAGEYIDRVKSFGRIAVKYRIYLPNVPTQPQNPNPLTLFLTEANVDRFQISGRLSLTDSLDVRFPAENYNVKNFPNIFG